MRRAWLAAVLVSACACDAPGPAELDTRTEACASCRMTISEIRFAAQVVAPLEEPKFFDDIGCLAAYLAAANALPPGAVAYVADHRTREWVRAESAVYTVVSSLPTPMASHLVAHAHSASRDGDPQAKGGTPRTPAEVFNAARAPGDRP